MPNGMPSWDEWNGLEEQQRQYSLYKILQSMDCKLAFQNDTYIEQKRHCHEEFASKKDVLWITWGMRAIMVGIIGAFLWLIKGA